MPFWKFQNVYILQKIASCFDHFPLNQIVNTCIYAVTKNNLAIVVHLSAEKSSIYDVIMSYSNKNVWIQNV